MKALADAFDAADSKAASAKSALSSAKTALADAETELDSAQKAYSDAQATYEAAAKRAEGLACYLDSATREDSFENGIASGYAYENETALVDYVEARRAAYAKAKEDYATAASEAEILKPTLAAAKARLDKAQAAYDEAAANLTAAQARYDAAHPAEAAAEEAAADAKVSQAKHAAGNVASGSAAVSPATGDMPAGEVFVIGGIAFVAAGCALGSYKARRRIREQM